MLIDSIINDLTNEKTSLEGALLKTRVLLHRIGHPELAEWVKHELEGYHPRENLPDYRFVSASIRGDIANIGYRISNVDLPTSHLKIDENHSMERMPVRSPISDLERIKRDPDNVYARRIEPEYYSNISRGLGNGFVVQSAMVVSSSSAIINILSTVRSRLLEFLLNLQSSVGFDIKDSEMTEKAKFIDAGAMFNHAIFGDGNTIVVGDGNMTKSVNKKKVSQNFRELREKLQALGVPKSSIDDLEKINKENDDIKKKNSINEWLSGLIYNTSKGLSGALTSEITQDVVGLVHSWFL